MGVINVNKTNQGYVFILLSALLFSSMEIALKLASNQFNPMQLTFLRFLIGAIVILPAAIKNIKSRELSLGINDFLFFALEGFVCIVVSMTFYQLAIIYEKASIVAVLFSCNPVFVVPFAYFLLHEKIYKPTIISLLICITGMVFIMNPFHMANNISGIIFSILSAATFALYGVIGKKRSDRYGGVVQSCFCFLTGSLEMLLLIFVSRIGFVSSYMTGLGLKNFASIPIIEGITLGSLPALIYIGVFVTGLGYTFYFLAIEKTSVTTGSLVFYIKPALAPVLALIILNEDIASNTLFGIIIILISSCISFVSSINLSRAECKKI